MPVLCFNSLGNSSTFQDFPTHSVLDVINLVRNISQNIIWDDETIQDASINDILTDIAYILDFYEPNEEWKKGECYVKIVKKIL